MALAPGTSSRWCSESRDSRHCGGQPGSCRQFGILKPAAQLLDAVQCQQRSQGAFRQCWRTVVVHSLRVCSTGWRETPAEQNREPKQPNAGWIVGATTLRRRHEDEGNHNDGDGGDEGWREDTR